MKNNVPFGYKVEGGRLVPNEIEAEIVSFIYERNDEYSQNPPEELVDIVHREERLIDKTFTMEMAREKAKHDPRIILYVTRDVNEKYGEQIAKSHFALKTQAQQCAEVAKEQGFEVATRSEAIIGRATYDAVQQAIGARNLLFIQSITPTE